MAIQSVTLSVSKFGYVNEAAPNTHYSVSSGTAYNLDGKSGERTRFYLGGLSGFPSNLLFNVLNGIEVVFAAKKAYATSSTAMAVQAYASNADFDAGGLTWANQPSWTNIIGSAPWGTIADTNWHDITANPYSSGSGASHGRNARAAVRGGAVFLALTGSSAADGDDVRSNLVAGGNPYVRIYYNDSVISTPTINVTAQPSSSASVAAEVDPRRAVSFSWEIATSESLPCVGVYAQTSAVFKWKAAGESSWHTANISGGTMSYTIPANTMPCGKTISWTVDVTLNSGAVHSAANAHAFTTMTSQITPSSYPSGTAVDPRSGKYFSWYFTNSFTQQSAALYWKTSTEQSYHSISASGTTTSLTVPAYTFPSGSTISWYLMGTDNLGNVSQSSVQTFSCVSGTISPTSYPTGSNVNTGDSLTFNWSIANAFGDIQQQSAVLYWKKSTEGSYHSIAVSSSLKRCIVPANTFPTSSSILWYVTATDPGGSTYTTSERSFTSVSPTVTAEIYPSGNGIYYGGDLRFVWKLSANGQGDYTQSSAKFYWRKDTQDNWTVISISGNVKSLTVPAYTFPPDKTITWYISATDFGGSTTETGQKTFKTAKSAITPQDSPTSGYADPREAITFRWYFTDGENTYGQDEAALKWRLAGEENWTTVSASGSEQSVTIAANTFPILSSVEWMLEGTDLGGAESETQVFTFSTTASTAYAVCSFPIGRVIDGSKEITFTWTVRNSDGSLPTRIVMEWKRSTAASTAWETVIDTTDPIMAYTMDANTLPAGPIDWRVTAYNRDSVAGPASLASFVCVAAPDTPLGLSATAVPRTRISWQPNGQNAYEIQIDGQTVRTAYGPEVTSWQIMEPLPDGLHDIRVRIQGEYGLWSDWAETSVSITNIPDGELFLRGKFRADAELIWSYDGTEDPEIIAIYRDGKWIGRTIGKNRFTDRLVLGEHTYRVEYWYEGGYYTRSPEISGKLKSDVLQIAALAGGDWLMLKLSERSSREQNFTWTQDSATHTVTGRPWPVLETAPYETLIGNYECAFRNPDCVRKFEQLRGQMVILKSRGGNVLIGGLVAMSKSVNQFYTSISFSVQQNEWEDFVNDDTVD